MKILSEIKILFNTITQLEKRTILEYLFLGLMGIYDLFLMSTTSTLYLPYPDNFQKNLFLVLLSVAIFKVIFCITDLGKRGKRCDSVALVLAGALLTVVYLMVYRTDGFAFLLFLGVLTLGCIGIDYRKILKLHVVLLALFLTVTCFCALGGAIENFVFMKDGSIRSSWGICYPTDFASAVFFMCLFTWVVLNRVPDILMFPIAVGGVWFARNITMSITSTLCFGVFAGVLLFRVLFDSFLKIDFSREIQNSDYFKCLVRVVRWFLIVSFPVSGLMMLGLILAYAKGYSFALIINNLLSRRLELPLEMYRECGLKIFGTPFAQIGAGFSTFVAKDYNFVDSTYPLILLRYGWMLFLSYCVIWPWTVYKTIRCRDWRLAWAMTLIALHSISEHHFIELNYNVLVAMPLACYELTEKKGNITEGKQISFRNQKSNRRKTALVITGIVFLIVLYFLPEVLSRMRTITEMLGWYGGGRNGIKVITVVTAGIGLGAGLLCSIYHIVLNYDRKKNFWAYRRWLIPGACCIVGLMGAFSKVESVICNGSVRYIDLLEKDEPLLDNILTLAKGKVYVHGVPQIYRNRFEGISTSVFEGDELARCYDTTVLIDRNYDSSCFIESGFLFMPVSEVHAIYTNDMSVIRGMEKKGYHLTGYYNIEKEVNLEVLRKANELEYKGEGLYLDGSKHSLIYGPYLSLYSGKFSVWYELQMDKDCLIRLREQRFAEGEVQDDYTIVEGTQGDVLLGTARVSAYNGQQVIKEQGIYISDFDEEGFASVEVPFDTGSYSGIEFLIFLQDDIRMTLNSIRYARTPLYDVHAFYNRNRLKYREEFYSLDGKKEERPEGYFAAEYGYNYDRAVNEIRYYDTNNELVLLKAGYSQVKRVLDEKNRVVREEYYGTDGERTLLPHGYSASEREYDEEGNAIVQRFYDSEDQPILTTWGYAEIHRVYDNEHRVIREAYFDKEGKPLNMPQGYAINEREYDEASNVIVQRYIDEFGSPVMTTWNYAEIHREFNIKKQVVKESYYDTKGDLIELPSGQAEVYREYNEKNQVIRECYFGVDSQPVNMAQGYAVVEREYDEVGNMIVERFCDTSGVPVITTWNYAEVHREFNEKKQIILETYYDTEGRPIALPTGQAGEQRKYDEAGCLRIKIYLGLDRNPVMLTFGYAEVHREYNEKNQLVKESYYDIHGIPIVLPTGQASEAREYNDAGKLVVQRYYDLNGKPAMLTRGFTAARREYNENGQQTRIIYYDIAGHEVEPVS